MTVFFHVSYSSLFVALVEREDYVEGNSLLAGSRAFSFVAGPSIGGILVQLLKAPYALLVDSISYLFSVGFLASIDPVEPEVEEAEKGHVVAGVRYIVTSSVMRSSLLATATINLFNFVFHALFILYAVRSLNVRPATLGIVLGAGAVGGLIGSVVTSRLGRRIGIGPTYILGCIVFPVPLVLVPLAGGPYWLILAMLFLAEFGAGLGVMILDISAASIFAALVPHRLRSRVSGAYMVVNNGVRPVGSLIGGFLGTAIGLQTTLWIGVVGASGRASSGSCRRRFRRCASCRSWRSRLAAMAKSLPWSWYSDPDVLRREQERIFRRAWQYVGHTGRVEQVGDRFAAWAGDIPVLVVRAEDGVRAFLNVCRHRGSLLVDGEGTGKSVQCPYHAWTYDLDGSLRAAPRSDREPDFETEGLSLVKMRLETWGPFLFVNPDDEAPPLADTLGPVTELVPVDDLVFHVRDDSELEANWKIALRELPRVLPLPGRAQGLQRRVRRRPGRVPPGADRGARPVPVRAVAPARARRSSTSSGRT